MARRTRIDKGGIVYHVINRRVGRMEMFETEQDYAAFEKVLGEACGRFDMRLLCYCLMPNHWHLVLWPRRDGQLSRFMQWLTVTHMRRWHAHRGSSGTGALYQGRYKSFPVQEDRHLLVVARYVERNAVRARLVRRAEKWSWCSLNRREGERPEWLLDGPEWPVRLPGNWVEVLNKPQSEAEVEEVRTSVKRGAPFGQEEWKKLTARRLGLESSMRDPWRPRKKGKEGKKKGS